MKRPRTKYPDRAEQGYRGATRLTCKACGSSRVWVKGGYRKVSTVIRYHQCLDCGDRFKTIEAEAS